MNKALGFILSISLLPIEIANYPIPITIVTFIMPFMILYLKFSKTMEVKLVFLSLSIALLMSLASSIQIESLYPFFSFLSFFSPISGFFLGLAVINKTKFIYMFIQSIWIPGILFAIASGINLINYSFIVRGSIETSNSEYGNYFASIALGDFFGLNMFATFGINSFAGIIFAFCLLLYLSYSIQNKMITKIIIIISIILIGLYGFLLISRSFYIGIFIFLLIYIKKNSKNILINYSLLAMILCFVLYFSIDNPRIVSTIYAFSSGDFESATSNRSSIWEIFFDSSNWVTGTAFKQLDLHDSASTSYHFYLLTLIAKSGLLVFFPLLLVIFLYSKKKKYILFNKKFDSILVAAVFSFLIQSLVWDIYAVQLYGHIAFFFTGLYISKTKNIALLFASRCK